MTKIPEAELQELSVRRLFHVNDVKFALFVASTDDAFVPQETTSEEADSKSNKALERNRDRRKIVSAAIEDLKESTIPEEDEEEDIENISINMSSSALSSLSSFKNKFQFSFSGKNKVN